MWNWHSKKIEISEIDYQYFVKILTDLQNVLSKNQHYGQARVTLKLLDLLRSNDIEDFIKYINRVDMWGGSGAVWEIYIEDKTEYSEFKRLMAALIDSMEKTKILGNGIKPLLRFF